MEESNITGHGGLSTTPTAKTHITTGVESKTIATITASIIFVMLVSVVAGTVFWLCRNRRPDGDEEELQSSQEDDQTYTDSRDFYMASSMDPQCPSGLPSGATCEPDHTRLTVREPRAIHDNDAQVLASKGNSGSDIWRKERKCNPRHFVQLEKSRIPARKSVLLEERKADMNTEDSYMMHRIYNTTVDVTESAGESRDDQQGATATVFDRFSDDSEYRSPIMFERV